MCGIIAIVGENKDKIGNAAIESMLLSLNKRGPDDKGTMVYRNCLLGQTRLSIIDLASGHQPMSDNKHDIAITFNGEIYNYRELRSELESKGHTFSTKSDTEVILKAYKEYGDECPKYLDGMFAFVIWDEENQKLFMARDRFGKKPLYYSFDDNDNLFIASEIKALFESGRIKGILGPEVLDNYLALMYIPPWKTVYKNIHTLPPASYATFKDGAIEIKKYWHLEKKPLDISYEEAREEVRRLLTEAVKKRMIADVEIGSFLSGGVDSTLVTLLAQSFSKTPIKTFSVGYEGHINELPFALEAAQKIGSDHHTLQAKGTMVTELHTAIEYFDEPHADSSDFPQYLLSKFAGSKVKVALSGDGADEFFLGYGWYTRHKNLSYREHFKEKVFMNPFDGFINAIQVFTPEERRKLWKDKSFVNKTFINDEVQSSNLSSVEKINLFDLTTYLPGQLLVKADRMGMANSLEVRSPFLDHRLAEFVYNLPEEYKTDNSVFKRILKDILGESMPKEFVHRRKQGFGAPIKKWLLEESFKQDIYDELYNAKAEIYNLLDEKFVKTMIDKFYLENRDELSYKIWVLYCLELWLSSHKKYHE